MKALVCPVLLGAMALAGMTGIPAAAKQAIDRELVLFECDFPAGKRRDGGWIPEKLFLFREKNGDGVLVYDPIIDYFVGCPIAAAKGDETKARVSYKWSVNAKDPSGQGTTMQYRFTYYRNGTAPKVDAMPGGFDNRFSSDGRCSTAKG